NYEIDVEAAGYKRAHERAEVGGDSSTVYVYMRPEGTPDPTTPVYPQPALSPKLQKEIERGIAAIHGKNYAEARQHLLKANKLAPSNADVEYLLGVVEYADHEVQLATSHFEKALSLVPEHEKSLISLGQIQLEAQPEKAKALLEKAVSTNNKNSQSHLLLALCN